MRNIDPGVVRWFQERGQLLQVVLKEVLGRDDVVVDFISCDGSPDDGMHIRVLAGNLEHQEHVWQEGLSQFDPDHLEACFRELERGLRTGHLQKRHSLLIVTFDTVPGPAFMPRGFNDPSRYVN